MFSSVYVHKLYIYIYIYIYIHTYTPEVHEPTVTRKGWVSWYNHNAPENLCTQLFDSCSIKHYSSKEAMVNKATRILTFVYKWISWITLWRRLQHSSRNVGDFSFQFQVFFGLRIPWWIEPLANETFHFTRARILVWRHPKLRLGTMKSVHVSVSTSGSQNRSLQRKLRNVLTSRYVLSQKVNNWPY